jgi:hypothetical protein
MGECVDHGQRATGGCNCNLIYHICESCHCNPNKGRWWSWLRV